MLLLVGLAVFNWLLLWALAPRAARRGWTR